MMHELTDNNLSRHTETTGSIVTAYQQIKHLGFVDNAPPLGTLKKHSALIHSSAMPSLLAYKMANVLLYFAYDNLNKKELHCIELSLLKSYLSYDSKNNEYLIQIAKSLVTTPIEWNIIKEVFNKKHENWGVSSFLASLSIIDGALVEYSYSLPMREYLYVPERYASLNLEVQKRINSMYALKLYEICKRYENIRRGSTQQMPLELWYMQLGITNYTTKDFNQKILKEAITEINNVTDISVYCEQIRHRKKIVKMRFIVKKQLISSHNTLLSSSPKTTITIYSHQILETLQNNYGLSEKESKKIMNKYGVPYTQEKIEYVEQQEAKNPIFNKTAYLLTAIKEDFKPPQQINKELRQKKYKENEEKMLSAKKMRQEQANPDLYRKGIEEWSKLSPEKQKTLIEEFDQHVSNLRDCDMIKINYRNSGIEDKCVHPYFIKQWLIYNKRISV